MVDGIGFSGSLMSSLSRGALSGYLDLGTSGRFSVDLQRGPKLDKAQYSCTPDVRLRIFKSEKSSKRSILSPCLVRHRCFCEFSLHISYHFVRILLICYRFPLHVGNFSFF